MLYNPPHFRDQDQASLLAFIERRGLATLVTLGRAEGDSELDVTLLPLLHEATPAPLGRLIGHVARANPQWRRLDGSVAAMALFSGGDDYGSPSWDPGKGAPGRGVATAAGERSAASSITCCGAAPDWLVVPFVPRISVLTETG